MIVGGMKFRGSNGERKKKNIRSPRSKNTFVSKPPLSTGTAKPFESHQDLVTPPRSSRSKKKNDPSHPRTPDTIGSTPPRPSPQKTQYKPQPDDDYGNSSSDENRSITSRSVTLEPADDGSGGIELLTDTYLEDEQRSLQNAVQMQELERQAYKRQWERSINKSGVDQNDPMVGIVLDTKSTKQKDTDNISDATAPSASILSENISKFAVQAVSSLLEKHLPSHAKTSDAAETYFNSSQHVQPPNESSNAEHSVNVRTYTYWKDVESFKNHLTEPSKQLIDLIEAIRQGGDLTRKKNACGAFKVMTSNVANRKKIAWTKGVLPAIAFVLNDYGGDIDGNEHIHAQKTAYMDSRIRILGALLNLCSPAENRILIFNCPGLIDSMIQIINNDKAESREIICACFSLLAKTVENRVSMVVTPEIMAALMAIISVGADKDEEKSRSTPKNSYSYNDDDDEIVPSNGSTDTKRTKGTSNDKYDKPNLPFLQRARVHIFACCLHLVKDKEAVYNLVRNVTFMGSIIEVANRIDSPAHTRCVAIIAHLTRLDANVHRMVSNVKDLLRTLVRATNSHDSECRKYACFSIENLSCERACRQEIANVPGLISALCSCSRNKGYEDQQLAAVSALRNLSDEPANMIAICNSKEYLSTLIVLINDLENRQHEKNKKAEMMKYYASDAVATVSFWMTTVADTNGKTVEPTRESQFSTLKVTGWSLWE